MAANQVHISIGISTILLVLRSGLTLNSNFMQKGEGCICSHSEVLYNLTYECTTVGGGTTLWRGTAFNCAANGNEVALRHSLFRSPEGATAQCNNGNITGRSLRLDQGNCYTSKLHVVYSPDLSGRTIECAHDNVHSVQAQVIGNAIIAIKTDLFAPPESISLSRIRQGPTAELTFNWTKIASDCHNIEYSITSNCGDCPRSTSINTAVCVNVPIDGHFCKFVINTVVCVNNYGIQNNSLTVLLKVPDAPRPKFLPVYSHVEGKLAGIVTTFMEPMSFNITDEVDGSAMSYTVTYLETSTNTTCASQIISPLSCLNGVCLHFFDLSPTLCRFHFSPIVALVSATNLLGRGPLSSPTFILDTNNFVNVTLVSPAAAVCTFQNQQKNTMKTCSITVYTQNKTCSFDDDNILSDDYFGRQSAQNVSNTVIVGLPFAHYSREVYCFVANATNGTYTALIQGMFNAGCDPNLLYDGPTVSSLEGATCDPPLSLIGKSDSYACYSGTVVGAYAVHRCLDCDYRSVRVCMADGNWNGTAFQCDCDVELTIQLSIATLSLIILLLATVLITLIACLIHEKKKNNVLTEHFQAKNAVDLSTIYEEVDSRPQDVMEENMAYNSGPGVQLQQRNSEDTS